MLSCLLQPWWFGAVSVYDQPCATSNLRLLCALWTCQSSTMACFTSRHASDENVDEDEVIYAVSVVTGSAGVSGVVTLWQEKKSGETKIEATVTGLTPGKHGFHIHELYGEHLHSCAFPSSTTSSRSFARSSPEVFLILMYIDDNDLCVCVCVYLNASPCVVEAWTEDVDRRARITTPLAKITAHRPMKIDTSAASATSWRMKMVR